MPYILNTSKDVQDMLKAIGVNSIGQLYSQIPQQIKLDKPLNLPAAYAESKLQKAIKELAARNKTLDKFNSFLGAGCYDHYVPAALTHILSTPQFLTAYTPYQAECSQGILQAIYEYQSFICLLTGMDFSNASLLDGASSFAEAVLMGLRITKRKKIVIANIFHPDYMQVLKTYLSGFNFTIQEIDINEDGFGDLNALEQALGDETACCVFSTPNFFGLIEDSKRLTDLAHKAGALSIAVVNPLSLAILKEPAAFGVDIVCGDGQPLGAGVNFGGSSFGFLAVKKDYLRQMPGRIVGKSLDAQGKTAYCLTLQAREQHIRREKATSNICSNQSLSAIAAAVYLSLMGEKGVKDAALYSFSNTQYLYQRLKEVRGIRIPYVPRFFNEFVWEVKDAPRIINELYQKNIIAGYSLTGPVPAFKNRILSCCTEKKTKDDIDNFVNTLAEVLHG